MRTWHAAMVVLLGVAFGVVVGCGGGASEDKPLDQVKAEAAKMNADQLRASANEYLSAIKAQQDKLKEVQDRLTGLKVTEMMSDKAKAIQADAAKIGSSVTKLQARMSVYVDELKKKGGDATGLE
ncbi:MAG TPA: hypothetical protein VMZ92_12280 [Planctomycetota bacterium]|nr:hypothetical protein [Planctomycetota bacterium]